MKSLKIITLVLAFVLLGLGGCSSEKAEDSSELSKPNILWIVVEDMSQDLGCYGNDIVNTPHIDGLAAGGMLFRNVFTTGPACSPSRTSLATGVYQTTLGAYHMRYSDELMPSLPEGVRILPDLLRESGYYTGNLYQVGETGKGKDDWLFKEPEESWDTRSWDELVAREPFYGVINISESHRPFTRNSKAKVDETKVKVPPYYPDHPVSREDFAGYYEEVNRADEHVGMILAKLKAAGKANNTIVVFISDHGRPMTRGKNWLYDSGTQIPFIVYFPEGVAKPARFEVGGENSQLISAMDLVAETLSAPGETVPDWMQAKTFLQKESQPREAVYTAVDRIGNINSRSRSARTRGFKYIRNYKIPGSVVESSTAYRRAFHPIYHLLKIMNEKGSLTPAQAQLLEPLAAEELYDLESDPFEMVNLAGNPRFEAKRQELSGMLADWIEASGDRGFEEESPAIAEYFDSYGQTTSKDLKKYGATTTDKMQEDFERMNAYVKSFFE